MTGTATLNITELSAGVESIAMTEPYTVNRAGAPEIEITPAMIAAAYAVLQQYGVRDVLEIDSDIMRALLIEALSVDGHRSPGRV
jgi:hypothetical protein